MRQQDDDARRDRHNVSNSRGGQREKSWGRSGASPSLDWTPSAPPRTGRRRR